MNGAVMFTHLDATDTYRHLVVNGEFAHVITLNTPLHGFIRPTHGVTARRIYQLLGNVQWRRSYKIYQIFWIFYDYILFTLKIWMNFLRVEITLERLWSLSFKLNNPKCVYAASSIEFLGHILDARRIPKSNKYIDAILHLAKPSTIVVL